MNPFPPSVQRMLDDPQAPTAPLDEFITAWKQDSNLPWRVGEGHLVNLLEVAVERVYDPDWA